MDIPEIPINPPKEWFYRPEGGIPTDRRITIQADGRVYGYIALWNTCHVGMQGCTRPPKGSPSDYEYAHQGETLTASGELIKTAVIAGGAGHAPLDMKTANVPKYYELTGTQLMRVRYGEDENGLWFAGALWPDVQDLQVAQIRASSMSGDWRWHAAWRRSSGQFDFAGACLVNIPGFPMPADGDLADRNGVPYALAATAFMPVNETDEYVYLTPEPTTHEIQASGDNVADCNGTCSECTCGKKDEVEPTVEQTALEALGINEEDLLAAAYQLIGKKMKKKPKTIKADADVDEESDEDATESEDDLRTQVAVLQETVNQLVADKLANEILAEN